MGKKLFNLFNQRHINSSGFFDREFWTNDEVKQHGLVSTSQTVIFETILDCFVCFLLEILYKINLSKYSRVLFFRNIFLLFLEATHGIFSADAIDRLENAPIDEIYVTDTSKCCIELLI